MKKLSECLKIFFLGKNFKIMRISLFLLFACFFQVFAANNYAQTKKLTISMDKATIAQVLQAIEDQSEFKFFYNNQLIDVTKKVDVEIRRKKIWEVLDNVLPDAGITYRVVGKQIALFQQVSGSGEPVIRQQPVTGKVTDESGKPLPGVTVIIKGTTKGTTTNFDGNYTITNVPDNATLVFSFVGMLTQEIIVGTQTEINVTMATDVIGIEEVVTIGFGTQKKVNLTGAVGVIKSEVFESRPVSNTTDMIQGVTPGLNIKATSGDPTGSPTINIRGIGTIGEGSSGNALVLIDGMEGKLNSVNPQDIESISVLKDAAASSIYGSRAPFGVILITTKSGKAGKININYNNNFRWSTPINMPKWMDSYTFAKYQNEAAINAGQNPQFLEEHLQRIKDYRDGIIPPEVETIPSKWYVNKWAHAYEPNGAHANNDWHDIMFKDVVFSQEHNASISGGNEQLNYYVSGRYQDLGGVISYNTDEVKRYNIASKFNVQLTKWAKVKFSQRFFIGENHRPHFATNDQLFGMISNHGWPTNPQFDPNGHFYVAASWALPVKEGGDYDQTVKQNDYQVQFELEPVKNWKTYAEFNYRSSTNRSKEDNRLLFNHDLDGYAYVHTADIRYYGTSQVWERYDGNDYFNTNIYSEYTKTLAGHTFKGMIGFQAEQGNWENHFGSRVGSSRRTFLEYNNWNRPHFR